MLFTIPLISVCVVSIIIFLYLRIKHWYSLSKSVKNVPGPQTMPLIGDLDFIRHRHDLITYLKKQSKRFPIFNTWLGPNLFVFVNDVELIQKIFAAPQMLQRPQLAKVIGLPNGLLENDYTMWRIHRKVINPSFNLKILQNYLPKIGANSRELVNKLSPFVGVPDFDPMNEVLKCGLMSILATTFGAEDLREEIDGYVAHVQTVIDAVGKRIFNPLLMVDFVYRFTTLGRREKFARKECYAFLDSLIDQRRVQLAKQVELDASKYQPQILIDLLLSPDVKFTEMEIKHECYTTVLAGFDTTSVSVCNTILLLAMHPTVQDKVAAEIAGFFAVNETVNVDNINQLEYLDMVMKETFRLLPALLLTAREPIEDFDLGPCTLKPGTAVMINIFGIQRDVKYWGADAELFNPERFALENRANLNMQAYQPFGGGQRNCIGQRFAIILVKVMLIHLLKAYKFSTKLKLEELKIKFVVTMRLLNKHLVTLDPR